MEDIVIGLLVAGIVAYVGYILGKEKNDSEIQRNHAETVKFENENEIVKIEFYEKMTTFNRTLLEQNEKLIGTIEELKDRVATLEDILENMACGNAPSCARKISITQTISKK